LLREISAVLRLIKSRSTARAIGAAIRAQQSDSDDEFPTPRRAKRHYGLYFLIPFHPQIHNVVEEYHDKFTGTRYARAHTVWFMEKGEKLPEEDSDRVFLKCSYRFQKTDRLEFRATVVGCDRAETSPDDGVFLTFTINISNNVRCI
jgi:hypothetical protein